MKAESFCVKEIKDTKSVSSHVLPIYASSSFSFDNIEDSLGIFKGESKGYIYSRYANPTIDAVSTKLAGLESNNSKPTFCHLTSSGMSAISTLISSILKNGDTILTQGNLYGGTTELFVKIFDRLGIKTTFVNLNSESEINAAIKKDSSIKMIYMESPSNPNMDCLDLAQIAKIAKKHQLYTAVDNTFCTPLIQQPFAYGIDFIVHSTTKFLNGHGNSTSGAILCQEESYEKKIWQTLKLTGATCNPFDAWLLNNGLKTLSVRMERHSSNAMALAKFLESHRKVKKVNYPGLASHKDHEIAKNQMKDYGGMLSFDYKGSFEDTLALINRLKFCTIAPTLGDVDTLLLHPASSSHINVSKELREKNGITESLIRVSVGIEHIDDIILDFDQALNH